MARVSENENVPTNASSYYVLHDSWERGVVNIKNWVNFSIKEFED